MSLKIAVIGSGGREHALVDACLKSPQVSSVVAIPGNGGMQQVVPCKDLSVTDIDGIVAFAQSEQLNFVICGPEVPLSAGLTDALNAQGIPCYGPTKAGAELEASKAFCKSFLERHDVPTAAYGTFTDVASALEFLDTQKFPIVIKASGLAAGKGVIIAPTREEAEFTVKDMLEGGQFGESGETIVIEEFMEGEEASLHLVVSKTDYLIMPMSQDHKRIGEGDTGLNTGGMGAYAPTGAVNPKIMEEIRLRIIEPTLQGLQADGIDYCGTLYIGLMLTEGGPKVVEFNVRFGDPETQVLLPLLDDDIVPALYSAAKGEALPKTLKTRDGFSLVVVLAAQGYPGAYPKGDVISLPSKTPENAAIYHAGTLANDSGNILTAGGRVLGVTGYGATIEEAREAAYALCDQVEWDGKTLRRDIAHRELSRS